MKHYLAKNTIPLAQLNSAPKLSPNRLENNQLIITFSVNEEIVKLSKSNNQRQLLRAACMHLLKLNLSP